MKTIIDFPTYEELPFIVDTAVVKLKGGSIRMHSELVDQTTGEIISGATTIADKEIDPTKFIKVYARGFANISNLNPAGVKLLMYIMFSMGKNVHKITIHIGECMKFCKYSSRSAVYKGLADLLENRVIAVATGKSAYWINPNIFYNGNPVDLVKKQIAEPPKRIASWRC